jgi:Uma2 family endonuclease
VTLGAPRHHYSFAEYLELEAIAQVRHEFFAGEIYAMAGGTPEHAAMAAAITTLLGGQLATTSCRVYSSDLRVRVLETGLATYPDVTVVCGPSVRDPESPTHVVNPRVVVEVLSAGTAEYDRTEKLSHYQRVPSLVAIVLVDHASERIELWAREADADTWRFSAFGSGETVPLSAIACSLPVDVIYAAARSA